MQLPEPFLGRMLLEVIQEDSDEFLKKKDSVETGVSKAFLDTLQIVHGDMVTDEITGERKFKKASGKVPNTMGKIIKLAPDAFGEAFKTRYGDVGYVPEMGDTVMFIANDGYRVGVEGKYYIISDEGVVGYIKAEVNQKVEVINE